MIIIFVGKVIIILTLLESKIIITIYFATLFFCKKPIFAITYINFILN